MKTAFLLLLVLEFKKKGKKIPEFSLKNRKKYVSGVIPR